MRSLLDDSFFVLLLSVVFEVCSAQNTTRKSPYITQTRIVTHPRTEPFPANDTQRAVNNITKTRIVVSQRTEPFATSTTQENIAQTRSVAPSRSQRNEPFVAKTAQSFSDKSNQTRIVASFSSQSVPFAADITKSFSNRIDQTRTVISTTERFATSTARSFLSENNHTRVITSQSVPFATDITKTSNRIDQTRTAASTTSEPFASSTARSFPSNNKPTRVVASQSEPFVANTARSLPNSIDQTRTVVSHGSEPFAATTMQNSLNSITQPRIVASHRTETFAATTTQSSLNSITQTRIVVPPRPKFDTDTQRSAVVTQTQTPILRTEAITVSATQRSFNVTQTRIPILPRTGPCVLNDDGMNCTEAGYYETVQCDANGCFCVAAHNGLIAYDTRTDSNRIAPKCSNCHYALKRIFAAGDPPKNTSIPKCDVSLGNYEPLQCDARQEYCYCVDPVSGRELPNTRKRKEKNQRIKCDNMDFSLDPALSTPEISQPQERYPVGKESCKLDRHRGTTCNGVKPSIRYYFDYQTFACLAFEYLGCGGNENNYRTSSDCSFDCKLQDLSGCGGMYPAARGTNGLALTCGNLFPTILSYPPDAPARSSTSAPPRNSPKLNEDGCPKDHKCVMGAFFGFCCSKANEDRWDKAYHPTCPNGRPPYSEMRDGWQETRFGKSCKDRFCPTNYTCHDSPIFSYCC